MNPMDITGRSILLTGGGSGIGRSLALGLAPKDVRLVLVGRHVEPLEEVAEQVRAAGSQAAVVTADLSQPGVLADVVAQATPAFGGIDVLINNAGNVRAGRIDSITEDEITEDEITAQLQLNLTAPILLTRAALPALRA